MKYIRILILFLLLVVLLAPPFSFLREKEKTVAPVFLIDTSVSMQHSLKESYTDSILSILTQKNEEIVFFDAMNSPKNFESSKFDFKLPVFITDGFIENRVSRVIRDNSAYVYLAGIDADTNSHIVRFTLTQDNNVHVRFANNEAISDTILITINKETQIKVVEKDFTVLHSNFFEQGVNKINIVTKTGTQEHLFYNAQKRDNIIYSPTLSMDTRFWISLFKDIDPNIEVVNSSERFVERTSSKKFSNIVFIYPDRNFENLEYDNAFYVLYDFVPDGLSDILSSQDKITSSVILNSLPIRHSINIKKTSELKNLTVSPQPLFFRWKDNSVFLGRDAYKSNLYLVLVKRDLPKLSQAVYSSTVNFFKSPSFFIYNKQELFSTGKMMGEAIWNSYEDFFVAVSNGEDEVVIDNFGENGNFSSYIAPQGDTITINAILAGNRFETVKIKCDSSRDPKPVPYRNRFATINRNSIIEDPLQFVGYKDHIKYTQKIRVILSESKVVLLVLLLLISGVWVGEFVLKKRA